MKPQDYFNNALVRKPSYWEDCNRVAVSRCPKEVNDWLASLPRKHLPQDYIPIKDFPAGIQVESQWFIAVQGENQFLVNREGYQFCRYAVRLSAV